MTTETITVTPPEDLRQAIMTFEQWAQSITVTTPEEATAALEQLNDAATLEKRIDAYWDPLVENAYRTHRALTAARNQMRAGPTTAAQAIKKALNTYHEAERRKAEEERRRLQRIADEAARVEREKAEAKAAAERAKAEEAARKLRELEAAAAAAETAKERARIEKERAKTVANANAAEERAAEFAADAAQAVAPVVAVETPAAVAAIKTRGTWKAEVIDANAIPREFLIPDVKAIDAYAKAMKEKAKIPGVRFYLQTTVVR